MRNVFDQYSQPENRLTHALVCALENDRSLLVPFLRWAGAESIPPASRLRIVEQQVPGELIPGDEDEAERRGLPDACVFDEEGWLLLIESKVQARVSSDQLRRHVRTAARYGFEQPFVLVLAVDPPTGSPPERSAHRGWREVYAWFRNHAGGSLWARMLVNYFEVFESRMVAADYSIRGTITMFSGLRFDEANPYNHREAKRLIKLLGDELQDRKDLRAIGADPRGERRTAITGRGDDPVWDFIPLRSARGAGSFTDNPHLTLTMSVDHANATITVPNGVKGGFRSRLAELGPEGFTDLMAALERRTRAVRRRSEGSVVRAYALQRHYPSQRSIPIVDARLHVDLQTLVRGSGRRVKYQPEWIDAVYAVLSRKRSNIQFGVGIEFSYQCPVVRSPQAVDLFAESWIALAPLLSAAQGGRGAQRAV